ncbi:MAG: Increased rDNA silencing protein [Alectoria sarmentosa]|nr:MAG: Increased rDNA silencing protein [Alectoria sarmentosa]CAD6594187.1 MAG: Increased rDNA silencing protein [Alectoria sarmentosa]
MTSRASRDHSRSNTDVTRQLTAFRGAFHAFSLAAPANAFPKAYNGTNGALAATTTAGTGMRMQGDQLAEGATSNGQKKERPSTKTTRRFGASERAGSSREQSPSYAAALHATSKTALTSTQMSIRSTPNSRQPSPLQGFMDNGVNTPTTTSRSMDETVVGATSSLVNLFESKQNSQKNVPITHSVRYVTKPTSAIANPSPIEPPMKPRLSTSSLLSTFPLASEPGKDFAASGPSKTMEITAVAAAAQSFGRTKAGTTMLSKSAYSNLLPGTVPEPPAPRRSGARGPLDASQESGRILSRISMGSAPLVFTQNRSAEPSTALQTPRSDPAFLPLKLSSAPPLRPLLPVRSSRSFEMKVDSLANTIVAASLASSRAPSPTKPPPPPPRRHKSHSLFHYHHSQGQTSRTPSPAKAMRQTMREPLPSDDEVEYKKKGILMRKHPHKHHEGDRKRYRATVTERERRRYDGVWAANRGLGMDADSSDSVLNLVVRDIWSRSRLPNSVLADIWDLVDIDGGDRLKRNEFVVGMWLIDQRLKGRKLPFTVSESLWNSVRLLHGVKVLVSRHQY